MTYKKFKNMDWLDLSFNQIGQEGFEYLMNYYIENPEYIPKELLIRGMELNLAKHLPIIKEFLCSTRYGFKRLNLKPNSLKKEDKEKLKVELGDQAWKIII